MTKQITLDISDLMTKRGMNQTELMRQAGVTYVTASALAKGKTSSISFKVLARLCEIFGVTPNDILILANVPEGKKRK